MHALFMLFQAIRPIEGFITGVALVSYSLMNAANMTLHMNLAYLFAAEVTREAFLHVNQFHMNFHAVRGRKSLSTYLQG